MTRLMLTHVSQNGTITYEHYCDTLSDRSEILDKYITLGSYCFVLHGTNGVDVYVADSNKTWCLTPTARPNLQIKNVSTNGTVIADRGYDGLEQVIVNMPNGIEAESLTIEENGTYTAPAGVVYTPVIVNVPPRSGRIYIVDPAFLLAAYNNNGGRQSVQVASGLIPTAWMSYFQSDSISAYKNGNDPYIRISRGNNKVIQFGIKIPASCQTLYLDIAADAGSESYPISTLNIVDELGITGYYSGNWSGNTLKSFTLTNETAPDVQEGLTLARTSARVVPRQVAEIDLSGISVDSYFTYFGCRSYFDIYGIWAE